MADRPVPYDQEAEEAVLGAMMLSASAREDAVELLRPEDFYVPEHAAIFTGLHALLDSGTPYDPLVLRDVLVPQGVDVSPERLRQVAHDTPAVWNVKAYAKIITDRAARRLLMLGTGELADLARDLATDFADVLARAQEVVNDADLVPGGGTPSQDVEQFLASVEDPLPWAIPGTLRRRERLLIVAEPGLGKTTLTRQWAVQVSQGIHPWQPRPIDPLTVLFVDCENEPAGSREEIEPLLARVQDREDYDPARLRLEFRPEGIDVLHRADQLWLYERVAASRPDILVVGPIYKLHNIDDNKAQDSKSVLQVLDRLRIRYRCALIMETHAPKECWSSRGDKAQPLHVGGSRVWTQWPEFVGGLEGEGRGQSAYWTQVRPPRYRKRFWPERLRQDGQRWPWEADGL